jgi:tRNA(fMet)-specific endonuclease VapC
LYLLDTNHFSYLTLGNDVIRQRISTVGREHVSISVITEGEILYMACKSEQEKDNLRRVQKFINSISIYSISSEIAEIYGQFKAELIRYYGPKERRKLRKTKLEAVGISDNDLWIACTALCHELTVVSTDRDFARIQSVMKFSLMSWL